MEVQVSNEKIYDEFLSSLNEEFDKFDFNEDDSTYLAESIISLINSRIKIKYNLEFRVEFHIDDSKVVYSVDYVKDDRIKKKLDLESWLNNN